MRSRWKLTWCGLCMVGLLLSGCVQRSQVRRSSPVKPLSSLPERPPQRPKAAPTRQAKVERAQPVVSKPVRLTQPKATRLLPPLRIAGVSMPRHPSFLKLLKRFRESDWGVVYLSLRRHRLYFKTMTRELNRYGVPSGILFLAGVESGFHPRIHSGKSAVGPWQFIPQTGRRYGLTQTTWIDERRNIKKASRAAAKYLRNLYKMFGSWPKAVSAYNCGERCLARVLKRCPNQTMWQVRLNRACRLSRETTEHVARIYAQLYYWKYPPQGRSMPKILSPVRYQIVRTLGPVFLEDVARYMGMKPKELYELNPELSSWTTPPGQRYPLKVPPALARKAKRFLRDTHRRRTAVWLRSYRVKRWASLASLSRQFRIPVGVIQELNHLKNNRQLRARRYLVLPMPKRRSRWAHSEKAKVERFALRVKAFRWMHRPSTRFWETRTSAKRRHRARTLRKIRKARIALHRRLSRERRRSKRSRDSRKERVWSRRRRWMADAGKDWAHRARLRACYRIKRGDSLWRISRKVGLSIQTLIRYNRNVKTLRVGRRLRLSRRACQRIRAVRNSRRRIRRRIRRRTRRRRKRNRRRCHRVRSGDSLWRIGRRYNVSVEQLVRWNRKVSTLRIGSYIRLSSRSRCR